MKSMGVCAANGKSGPPPSLMNAPAITAGSAPERRKFGRLRQGAAALRGHAMFVAKARQRGGKTHAAT